LVEVGNGVIKLRTTHNTSISFVSCRGVAGFQRPMRMAKHVYPSTLFDSSIVRPDHRFAVGSPILKFSGVDHRADPNHTFPSRDVGNIPNIPADSFQGVEPSRPPRPDITTGFNHAASGLNKKD